MKEQFQGLGWIEKNVTKILFDTKVFDKMTNNFFNLCVVLKPYKLCLKKLKTSFFKQHHTFKDIRNDIMSLEVDPL